MRRRSASRRSPLILGISSSPHAEEHRAAMRLEACVAYTMPEARLSAEITPRDETRPLRAAPQGEAKSIQMRRDPGGGGEQPVVLVAQPDKLDAERQALGAAAGRQGNTGRAGKRPDRVEAQIA